MSEKHSLLAALEMTANGSKVLHDFYAQAQEVVKRQNLAWAEFLPFLEDQIYYALQSSWSEKKPERIDAEMVLAALESIGTPEEIIARYGQIAGLPKDQRPAPAAGYRKLYRSPHEKLVAGVCGGIAEYFQVDPVLVRGAFIISCFLTGITIPIYLVLWLVLPMRNKAMTPTKAAQPLQPVGAMPTVGLTAKKGLGGKIFGLLALVIMTVCFYLPATLILLGGASYCIWGIFYPILNIEGFRFSFSELRAPGMVLAIFASTLFFCLFLLVTTFMMRLHFKTRILGKNSLVLVILGVVVSLFGAASSFVILLTQNKSEFQTTCTQTVPLPPATSRLEIGPAEFKAFSGSLTFKELKIRADDKATLVTFRCLVSARGQDDEAARQHVEAVQVVWPETAPTFPRLKKQSQGMHFEKVVLEMIVPANLPLSLQGICPLPITIEGNFLQPIVWDMEQSRLCLEKVTAASCDGKIKHGECVIADSKVAMVSLVIEGGSIVLNGLECSKLGIHKQNAFTRLRKVIAPELQINSERGMTIVEDCQGTLNLKNRQGKVVIENCRFTARSVNVLENEQGEIRILVPDNEQPQLKIKNQQGTIHNRLQSLNTSDAVLEVYIVHGKLILEPYHPKHQ